MRRVILVRSAIAITAVVGLAAPASAVVDLEVKRAIVGVVLDNLGVDASDAFIAEIAQGLDVTQLDTGLVTAVNNLLDTGSDPRSVIESQTDKDGDGVPDEGAALEADDDNAPNPNSTEKAGNSNDKSSNSSNRNPNGTTTKPKTTSPGEDATDNNDDAGDDNASNGSSESEDDNEHDN